MNSPETDKQPARIRLKIKGGPTPHDWTVEDAETGLYLPVREVKIKATATELPEVQVMLGEVSVEITAESNIDRVGMEKFLYRMAEQLGYTLTPEEAEMELKEVGEEDPFGWNVPAGEEASKSVSANPPWDKWDFTAYENTAGILHEKDCHDIIEVWYSRNLRNHAAVPAIQEGIHIFTSMFNATAQAELKKEDIEWTYGGLPLPFGSGGTLYVRCRARRPGAQIPKLSPDFRVFELAKIP